MAAQHDDDKGTRSSDTLRVLAVADVVEPHLYNGSVLTWLPPIDLIISCGDLPPGYLDFLVTILDAPLMHVLGNHCDAQHDLDKHCSPEAYPGAHNLHQHVKTFRREGTGEPLLLAGMEGSPLYNDGPHQYTEAQARRNLQRLVPGLLRNKLQTGRYLDILVTHSPPRGIHDDTDIPHKGFTSLVSFIERYKPFLVLHGHTHRYQPLSPMRTMHGDTEVINVFGHVLLELEMNTQRTAWQLLKQNRNEGEPRITDD